MTAACALAAAAGWAGAAIESVVTPGFNRAGSI
jgi:hypothetical protein